MIDMFYEETATTDLTCHKCLKNINRSNEFYIYDGLEKTLYICYTCYLSYLNNN